MAKKPQSTVPANLVGQMKELAREGYVTLPVRKVFGERMQHAGPQWRDVYNCLVPDPTPQASNRGSAPGGASTVAATEVSTNIGTEGLGYMTWGPGNRQPNIIALVVSMLPYTAVGVKFNADVVAGLGPRPVYRYTRMVNGALQTDVVDYHAAAPLLRQRVRDLKTQLKAEEDAAKPNAWTNHRTDDGSLARRIASDGNIALYSQQVAEGINPSSEDPNRKETNPTLDDLKQAEEDLRAWEYTHEQLKEFERRSNLQLVFLHLATEMAHMGICFPELQLDRQAENPDDSTWTPKVIALQYQPCVTTRLERQDEQNRINYVYVSNQWLDPSLPAGESRYKMQALPALDPFRPLASLEEKVRDSRIRAFTGRLTAGGKQGTTRPTHFVLPTSYPSPGRPYYPEPAWWSILKGDVYKYTSTIIENRAIAKENANSAGKIIYIHTEYLARLYSQEAQNNLTEDQKGKLRDQIWEDINRFLQDKENNGQTILSFTFLGSDGKDHDAWRIVDVPISNKQEADANKTELEELSNVIFLALGIHSSLIGNTISSSSTGGTQQRELYELKKLFSVPTQRLLLKPLYVVRDFNRWDEHLDWEVQQMTLTTLDRNKNGIEETKV